jgi:hypothetical protein
MSGRTMDKVLEFLKGELESRELKRMEIDIQGEVGRLIERNRELGGEATSDYGREALQREEEVLVEAIRVIGFLRAEKILRDVYECRKSENMNQREAALHEALASSLRWVEEPKRRALRKTIIVRGKIPAFIGSNGREHGPFEPGDVASIHEEDFEMLRKEGLVEEASME